MSKKIPVSQSPQPLAGNPFAALDLGPLPPGPESMPVEDESQIESRAKRDSRSLLPPIQGGNPKSKIPRGRIVLRREKSQRGGKTVVIAGDFAPHFSAADLEELARWAKKTCGCGGTVAGREIELQGDDPARLRKFFEAEGFRVAGV